MSRVLALRLLSFAFVIFVIGSYVIVAQNAITGNWSGDTKDENPDKIQLNFEIRTDKGGRNNHGSSFAYSDLQGLSRDQAQNGRIEPIKSVRHRRIGAVPGERVLAEVVGAD